MCTFTVLNTLENWDAHYGAIAMLNSDTKLFLLSVTCQMANLWENSESHNFIKISLSGS
jgi:hypothetical protein